MSSWTPGKWAVYFDNPEAPDIGYIRRVGGEVIADEIAVLYGETAMRANAHLIAASPELYEALEGWAALHDWLVGAGGATHPLPQDVVRKFAEMLLPLVEQTDAALKKARGW